MNEGVVLLTVQEFATLFGKRPQAIYAALSRNQFCWPVERTGSRFYIRVPTEVVVAKSGGWR